MSARLSGKNILVNGGASGIGLEIAQRFVAEGARVAITGRNPETLAAARHALPGALVIARSDAGSPADQIALAAKMKAVFGQLDAVVVNAGIGTGPRFLLQALSPLFAKSTSVVLMASKAALLSLMRTLSAEWAASGARVNAISPRLMKRFGAPREIADAAVFLASDESSDLLGGEIVIGASWQ